MKKNVGKVVSFALCSLFVLSSTVTLGMIGYSQRIVMQTPLASADSQIVSTESKDEALTEENGTSLPSADEKAATTVPAVEEAPKTTIVSDNARTATTFSRGGINPYSYTEGSTNSAEAEKAVVEAKKAVETTQEIEVLDWWQSASSVFAVGSVATVKDVYTGKTFKVKRTMGTNHSDTEALTLEDTKIIKSIWGGFSWERRPIHIYINGRILAASMSAMPHAGIDSAPAYAYVENRSEGYGAGSNLDVVKNNGMDGHFDIHFLNSTRHKDGQPDPQHQAAIKVAAASGK